MRKSTYLRSNNIYQIKSPFDGIAINQSNIPDDILKTCLCGKGAGVVPNMGLLYAPFDGTITDISENNSTLFLKSDYGLELMIQIGINTELLNHSYFPNTLKTGDTFLRGHKLVIFDLLGIQTSGYSTVCSVLVKNYQQFNIFRSYPEAEITPYDTLLEVDRIS